MKDQHRLETIEFLSQARGVGARPQTLEVLSQLDDRRLRRALVDLRKELAIIDNAESRSVLVQVQALLDRTRSPLTCPDCGSTLSPIMEYKNYDSSFEGMECDNHDCSAVWDKWGNV